ncbi:MAG TPA: Glu/Leu/Phe/Val dehydrogenase [bacterium]|nr:Glu/Leu/Phe/Val dehydrogenase [bacterium]HMW32573.1 Glu/Leu/Phe/Val dehydrogenase [bacterium]HMW35663.1 Glu/Leu/Phe/Val dehydrogenase [bacterium]HMY34882.1 Glu/Leu/Phe/Val dehydrogenase [bacterium]HMZ04968.1 Glu/Leu/Phe/Val dehydrogenase [bacterium]
MRTFEMIEEKEHEQVVFFSDKASGLRAIVAIHDTTLGPALGGCRMYPYATTEEALNDVLRLSRGMSYKAAVAGLNLGGGKAVIIGDPKKHKNEILFRTFGRFIQGLGGRYITAEDVGTSVTDMEWIRMETRYVTGISRAQGGSGDPSPVTALGTYRGLKACVEKVFGTQSLKGLRIAVQGLGHVGYYLVRHLHDEGAKLVVTDVDGERVKRVVSEFGAEYVDSDKIYDADVDVFSPCAMGAIINDDTIGRLKCKIIAGAANNQLQDEARHGAMLLAKKITYAPDYVINAGGLINVYNELEGYNQEKALAQAKGICDIMKKILELAERENISTHEASNRIAEERIRQIGHIKSHYVTQPESVLKRIER